MSQLQQQDWKLPTADEFVRFFQSDLAPYMADCESDRKKAVRNVILLVSIVVVIATIAVMFALNAGAQGLVIVIAIGAAAIMGIGYTLSIRDYRRAFKHILVARVVRFFGPDFEYDPDRCIPESQFAASRIFDHGIDRYRGEDFITGTAGKTRFECSEIYAEYKTTTTDSKGRRQTQWHTIFKGLFFIADFNKDFHGITLVLPDTAESAFGWIGKKLQAMNFTRPGELVTLEDPEFEKLFVVYGTDQIEARYILSPSLMSRLVDFRRQMGQPVHISFLGGYVHIAVNPGKDLLEPSIFSGVNFDTCRQLLQDLSLVLGIVSELNLNTRIWSKQ